MILNYQIGLEVKIIKKLSTAFQQKLKLTFTNLNYEIKVKILESQCLCHETQEDEDCRKRAEATENNPLSNKAKSKKHSRD